MFPRYLSNQPGFGLMLLVIGGVVRLEIELLM